MAAAYARCILGVFAFDREGRVLDFEAFPSQPGTIAGALLQETTPEEEALLARQASGEGLRRDQRFVLDHLDGVLEAASVSLEEYRRLAREVSFELVESSLKALPRDRLAMEAIGAIDQVEEAANLLSERYREWEGSCYPGGSPAAGLAGVDVDALGELGGQVSALKALKAGLEEYLTRVLEETAPNLSALLGPGLAGRLISLAGGLERLAVMPGSKIQVLGAEKALFRHVKDGTPPPKHGAIFQFPAVKGAPWWQRGKIARALANKAAMAARADAFSGDYIADELKAQLERRFDEIRRTHPKEPRRMRIIRTPRGKGKGKPGKKRRRRR
ncbi:MAG: hypothetical protein GXO65_01720 [Euryarchaeota archaeon]|nr:hypothetical protein [Euryarchaeota archaeon]